MRSCAETFAVMLRIAAMMSLRAKILVGWKAAAKRRRKAFTMV